MSGVFGAGIVTALEENNAYPLIHNIDAGSAGAINAAYFLARQSKLGSSIYWEDLPRGFLRPELIASGVLQRFCNRYVPEIKINLFHNIIDIDFLLDVLENKKVLDVNAVIQNHIPLGVKVLDVQDGGIKYLDAKIDTLKVLKASVCAAPYYFSRERDFIDGDIAEPIGIDYLLEKNPNHKIVVALNNKPDQGNLLKVRGYLEGLVAEWMYPGRSIGKLYEKRVEKFMRDVYIAKNEKRVLLVHPPEESPTGACTRDPIKLRETWEMGRKSARKILDFIS